MEIEGNSEEDINNILERLGFSIADAISCTADEVYRLYGKSMFDSRELKFEWTEYFDMFPRTTKRAETVVDQVGRTDGH